MPERARAEWKEIVSVPRTMDGWAVRVLTVAIVICMIAAIGTWAAAHNLSTQIEEAQAKNREYQSQAQTRGCLLLKKLGSTPEELVAVGCAP